MVQVQTRHPRLSRPSVLLLAATCLAGLLCAGCGGGSSAALSPSPMPSVLPTLMPSAIPAPPPPTATPISNCANAVEARDTKTTLPFPLPANTVTYRRGAASGAGFYLECTLGATRASITAFFNAHLPAAGWHPWNPQVDNAGGCGTQDNAYWLWVNSQDAVGWDFNHVTLPEWHLTFCILAFATPAS